jgi:hypothetical protein
MLDNHTGLRGEAYQQGEAAVRRLLAGTLS